MQPVFFKGRGNPTMYDDLMDFINYVFGFNGNGSDFKKLLPKLYNPEYDPCRNNFVITENGKLRAAIGAFDSVFSVGGTELKCRGIGNVAVHPYHRSKGYMIECMNMINESIISDGYDFSMLGGQRQRYGYFGYEDSGCAYSFLINGTNIRHCFRDVPFCELEIRDVHADDTELIDAAYALYLTRPMRTVRKREEFLDICHSWKEELKVILRGGEVIGYFVGGLGELTFKDSADFDDVIRNYVSKFGKAELTLPSWDEKLIAAAYRITDYYSIRNCYMYSIYNYKRVLGALLSFRASISSLCDFSLNVLIHGIAGDERLTLSVKDGSANVTDAPDGCEIALELEHKEALAFFCSPYSPLRHSHALSPALLAALPLPLFTEGADHV